MSETSVFQFLEGAFSQILGERLKILKVQPQGGGCINDAYCVSTEKGRYFVKSNESMAPDMFEKEAEGLRLLHRSQTVRVPGIIGYGGYQGKGFLILEYLTPSRLSIDYWQKLGKELAMLHQVTGEQHGLAYDNYIGRLKQVNNYTSSWVGFFTENRLETQLKLAYVNGHVDGLFVDRFRKLYEQLPSLLPELPPSLLHGDLWSGNVHRGPDGHAWLIDPAVYHGSREIELAFTHLFGGFDQGFYSSYVGHFPLEPGFEERIALYNLYPLLVHVNLFGASYLSGIKQTLKRYIG